MKYFLQFLVLLLGSSIAFTQTAPTSGAFTTDETDFFVSGNKVNDSLERVNLLLCYLENTKPVTFLNKGSYVATIFEDDCNFGKARAGDKDKATKSRGGQAGGGNSGGSNKKTGKAGNTTFLTVTQTDGSSPMEGKVWIQLAKDDSAAGPAGIATGPGAADGGGGDGLPFDATVYLKYQQTSNPTADNVLGNFTMNYSLYADAAKIASQFGALAPTDELDTTGMTKKEKIEAQNFSLGNGYVKSENNTILFKESIMGIEEISISYNDTGAQGVYTHELWDSTWASSGNNSSGDGGLVVYTQFIINDTGDWYCEKVLAAEAVNQSFFNTFFDFNNTDGKMGAAEGQAAQTVTVTLSDTGLSSDEICYSTKKSDAYKNVWRYGVYDSDGSRVGESSGSFPMRATNPSSGDDYYGWADYWGIWVDTYGRASFDPTALSWKRDDGKDTGPCATGNCALSKTFLDITKFETTYKPLDSINKIKLSIDVGWDSQWASAWGNAAILNWGAAAATVNGKTVGGNGGTCNDSDFNDPDNHVCFYSYEGYWDSAQSAFVITHGMKWSNNGNPRIELVASDGTTPAPKTITQSEYATVMVLNGQTLDMWTWSPDTFQSFQIPGAAVAAPTSTAAGVGLKSESVNRISVSQLAADLGTNNLKCITNCLKPDLLNARYEAAADAKLTEATADDGAFNNVAASIFDTDATPWFDNSGNLDRIDGITASYVVDYVLDSGKMYFESVSSTNEMTISSAVRTKFTQIETATGEPIDWQLGSLQAALPEYDASSNPWATEYIGWSARTGKLVSAANLAQLECDKDGGGDYYFFDDDHPRYDGNATLMNATRYCEDKLWQGAVSTYYEVMIMMNGNYQLSDGGTPVVIDQPKTLELDTTSFTTANSGIAAADIGKTYSLWFEGFGNLFNIPGGVFDTCTGEFLGEYFYGNWSESCHRWASKFTIPTGSVVTDNSASPAQNYFVKALSGDEFLKVLSTSEKNALPARDYSSLTKAIMGPATDLIDTGPNGTAENYIGTVPTTLLNSGEPSVLMGEVIAAPPAN